MNKKWEDTLKTMLEANAKSNHLIFESDDEKLDFVLQCEKVYRRSTMDHIEYFKTNNFEGNVDENRWYRFACYLIDQGYVFI